MDAQGVASGLEISFSQQQQQLLASRFLPFIRKIGVAALPPFLKLLRELLSLCFPNHKAVLPPSPTFLLEKLRHGEPWPCFVEFIPAGSNIVS